MSICPDERQSHDSSAVELLCHARAGDQAARVEVEQCLEEVVRGWFRRHPRREAACQLESEEHYIVVAFMRFWQVTSDQQRAFNTFADALPCVRASLNAAILERLRADSRPKAVPLPQSRLLEKPLIEVRTSDAELWKLLQGFLLNVREQRLAYLLFHCGLEPWEIVHSCSQEFNDVSEIFSVQYRIIAQLLSNGDPLRLR